MINRFSHITRLVITALLFTGFAAHLAVPFFGDMQKNAFTQWLNYKIAADGDELNVELRDQIRQLPKESTNFWKLVQDASKLISEHKENFQIAPAASAGQTDIVFTWLIGQWSTYKHQQSNANAVLPEIIPPIQKWLTQSPVTQFAVSAADLLFLQMNTYRSNMLFSGITDQLSPPSGGISINAP